MKINVLKTKKTPFVRYSSTLNKVATVKKQQGIEKGIEKGIGQGETRILKRQLQQRFGQLSRQHQHIIDSASLDDIERWSMLVLTAESIDDVLTVQ